MPFLIFVKNNKYEFERGVLLLSRGVTLLQPKANYFLERIINYDPNYLCKCLDQRINVTSDMSYTYLKIWRSDLGKNIYHQSEESTGSAK